MKKLLWPVLLSVFSLNAAAQGEQDGNPDGGPDGGPPRLSIGIASVLNINGSPYAGESAKFIPFPLINYHGDNFYFRGVTAGWNLIGSESFELSAITKFRFDGFSVDNLGEKELADNGIDYRLLEDRDMGLDAGLSMKWNGAIGEIEVELLADITDASGGQEASIQYSYPFQVGKGMLALNAGATWLSDDMANYYYGTLDEEVTRGVVNYKPDAVVIPHIGFSYFRPIGEKWSFMAITKYSMLPDEITDSPLMEPDSDGTATTLIGFSRAF